MTENDSNLLKEARQTKYWEFQHVFDLAERTDSEIAAGKIRNIAFILRDIDERGYRS